MAVLSLEEQLAEKQQQLLDLQLKAVTAVHPVMQSQNEQSIAATPPITMEQIQELIDAGVSKKLSELGGLPVIPEKVNPKSTPLEIVNALFTPEEVIWLCNPTILRGVDKFLMDDYIHTEEGKTILKQFFQAYRKSHG